MLAYSYSKRDTLAPVHVHVHVQTCTGQALDISVGDFTQWNEVFIDSELVLGLRLAFESDL